MHSIAAQHAHVRHGLLQQPLLPSITSASVRLQLQQSCSWADGPDSELRLYVSSCAHLGFHIGANSPQHGPDACLPDFVCPLQLNLDTRLFLVAAATFTTEEYVQAQVSRTAPKLWCCQHVVILPVCLC
jgi:hypothetical protein